MPADPTPLLARARHLGASDAALIDPAAIPVRAELAGFCPDCPSHGMSASCPPYVAGPDHFRELQATYRRALILKLEVPAEVLLTEDRHEVFQLLHEVVADVEREAARSGFPRARGFAGGGCQRLFCPDERDCAVLDGGECRHPDQARQSMSGYGVDVGATVALAGWTMGRITAAGPAAGVELGVLAGLVLLDCE